jgi:hypothetical protein
MALTAPKQMVGGRNKFCDSRSASAFRKRSRACIRRGRRQRAWCSARGIAGSQAWPRHRHRRTDCEPAGLGSQGRTSGIQNKASSPSPASLWAGGAERDRVAPRPVADRAAVVAVLAFDRIPAAERFANRPGLRPGLCAPFPGDLSRYVLFSICGRTFGAGKIARATKGLLVGAPRFELGTPSPPDRAANSKFV